MVSSRELPGLQSTLQLRRFSVVFPVSLSGSRGPPPTWHPLPGGPGPHVTPSAATCVTWHLHKEHTWREKEEHGEEGEIM